MYGIYENGEVIARFTVPLTIRSNQPVLVINDAPLLSPDPLVRPAVVRDLEILLPACVSMFTEEVGVSPVVGRV